MEAVLNSFPASIIDQLMKAVWAAAMWLLRTAFSFADGIGGFRDPAALADAAGKPSPAAPFFAVWPTLMWIGGAVAVGLFLWQLTMTMIHGGAGFWRLASGPVAFSVATALTLGAVAALVGAAEGLTVLLLQRGLAAENFRTVLDHPNLGLSDSPALESSIDATARAVLLGLVALFGVLPAALGFLLQTLFRQAVILVLIATVPITAAGLVANTTASWFWRSLRWMLAAILMKPALALVLVIGVNMLAAPTGLGGLLAGTGVLMVSLCCPLVLFRLLAFVEHGVVAGVAARAGAAARADAVAAVAAGGVAEQVNVARFDAAADRAAGSRGLPSRFHRSGSTAAAGGRTGFRAVAGSTGGAGESAGTSTPARVRTGTDGRTALPIGATVGPSRARRPGRAPVPDRPSGGGNGDRPGGGNDPRPVGPPGAAEPAPRHPTRVHPPRTRPGDRAEPAAGRDPGRPR